MANKLGNSDLKKSEEEKIKRLFEEEIGKPYYGVFYLDNFKLPYEKLDVSIIIPTYNRSPYKPGTLKEAHNPLFWSVKTALMQKPRIKEIIIVDDASTDFTKKQTEELAEYARERNLPLVKYIKSRKKIGISAIRNFGVKHANGKYLFFIDDDCFIAPYAAFGGVYTFEELEKHKAKVGAINLPTYGRRSTPRVALSKKDIGVIDFVKGLHKANKDCFPTEYLLNEHLKEKFLNSELQILNPFVIQNMNTVALCPKKIFEEIGGFPEHIIKRMEDREFGCRLIENGYQIFYQPDPKFHCVHGSYGLKTGQFFIGEDWFKKIDKSISIKKAMEICEDPRANTGARINSEDFIYDYILAFFCLIYERNKKGAINWIKGVYEDFVKNGQTRLFGNPNILSPNETKRKEMWFSAISEGLRFIKKRGEKDIMQINETIKRLKSKDKTPENILGVIDNL